MGPESLASLHAITLMIAWQLRHELETVPANIEIHLVPTLCPLAVSPFDFSGSGSLIERAVQSTRRWIDGGGLARRSGPEELAPHHH